jgi:hypothetical protein
MKTGIRSIGEVRSVTPAEMQPIFGSYHQPLSEALKELLWLSMLMTVVTFVGLLMTLPQNWSIAAFPLSILMALLFGVGIIGVRSPFDRFSWRIPISEVDHCQLVQASPHRKLRVIKNDGTARSLPVTSELWDAVLNVKPAH